MGLLDQILGAALGGPSGQTQGGGGLGGIGDLLSGLAGGRQQSGSAGGGASLMTALLPVLMGMLANRGGGGSGMGGGLEGLLRQFQNAGLGQQANSWVGTGANMPVSADDLARVFGRDQLAQIASQAGVGEEEASHGLASLLPEFVNQLTPKGELPPAGETEDALSSLQKSLGL